MTDFRKRMSNAHEEFLASLFGGSVSRGSGNQWNRQMDGRQSHHDQVVAWAWDGKATQGVAIGVSRQMWAKAIEQAHGERPMLGLRFCDAPTVPVYDLAVVNVHDLAELQEVQRKLSQVTAIISEVKSGSRHYDYYEEDGPDHMLVKLAEDIERALR